MKALAILGRSRQPVTYEVRLEVDSAIAADYDAWLPRHVREMLALPGFQSATIFQERDGAPENRVVRVVSYEVRSRRELKSYLHAHAPRMRQQGVERFGKRFSASRRTVPTADYVPPAGMDVLHDVQSISGGLPVCGNCHEAVTGRFCAHCGQEDRTYMLSLGELVYDFIGDLFNFDSRFFRTMRPLLFRPGLLTTEYLRGHRQRHLPPVRMYIFISLVFFLFANWLTDAMFTTADVEDALVAPTEIVTDTRELSPEERAEVERALTEAADSLDLPEGTLRLPESSPAADTNDDASDDDAGDDAGDVASDDTAGAASGENDDDMNFNLPGLGDDFEARLERGARALQTPEAGQEFVRQLLQQIPTMMFIFLPLIALTLKVLYIGSSRYYVEHLIFTLHVHSAVFLLLLGWLLFGELAELWTPLQSLSGWLAAAIWIYIPVYLYKSMRRVYGQGHFFTTVKYILLLSSYVVSLTLTLAATAAYTLYQQA